MSVISIQAKLEAEDIDLQGLDVALAEAFVKTVGVIAKGGQNEWTRIAQARLRSSRADYINGLRKKDSFATRIIGGTTIFEIALIGRMPNNFEFGMDGFDMKTVRPGWLGGGKAKTNKDGGKYITIPFRHSLSSAAAIQYSGQARRMELRKELVQTVKDYGLDKMVRASTGAAIPGPVKRVPNTPNVHPFLRGLTRYQQQTTGGRGQGRLMTFRIMSENSKPDSWIHPGITAANIMPEVERWIDRELDRTIEMMFGNST